MDESLEMLIPYGVAALLGALVGLERQYSAEKEDQLNAAGIRTHSLWCLVGVLTAHLSTHWQYLYVVGLGAAGLILGVANVLKFYTTGDRGLTSELSQLAVYLIAALVAQEQYLLAVPITVGVTILLRAKESLHNLSDQFGRKEMNATLMFAVIAGAVLPFLPDRGIGPFGAFNLREIWLMVVLVSGISFFGYMLALFMGNRGIELTGFLAGLVSSTAATMQLSRHSREAPSVLPYVRALLLAITVAFPRILLLVALVGSTELLERVAPTLVLVTLLGITLVLISRWLGNREEQVDTIKLENPLRLTSVLSFGALYAIVVFLVEWAKSGALSEQGILTLSSVSGITGMTAITLSLCRLEDISLAASGILFACAVATLVKCLYVLLLGAPAFRLWTILGLLALTSAVVTGALWLRFPAG